MTKTTNQTPELNAGVYALFVDLAKAFDSVDRELLWQLLENKCGVPSSRKLNSFWYGKIRDVLGISWVKMRDERITNEECARRFGVPDWRILVGKRHARWIGHVARMAPSRPARQTLFGSLHGRRGMRTGLRKDLVIQAIKGLAGLPELDNIIWAHIAQDKKKWDSLCDDWNPSAPTFSTDNPKRCPLCESDFEYLGKHIASKHPIGIEKFKCNVPGCEQEFLTKQARTKHKKTDHGIDVPKPCCCPYEGCKYGPYRWNSDLKIHSKRVHN